MTSIVLALALWLGGAMVVDFMTTGAEVRTVARDYMVLAALVPLTSVWCFMLDGIFVGATATKTMRTMMLISLAIYLMIWALCVPGLRLGNNGLWIALHAFFIARALTLGFALPKLERDVFAFATKH